MEKKKNNKANLEKMKTLFFIISIGIVFAIINYAFSIESRKSENTISKSVNSEISEIIPITRPPDEKPKPKTTIPKHIITDIINIVVDSSKIETPEFYIPEFEDSALYQIPKEIDTELIYNPSVKPKFPGGIPALQQYIAKHTKYPNAALRNEIQGTVFLRFEVTKKGTIGTTVVLNKSVDKLLQDEAIRVIKSLPNFNPGIQNGKPVSVWFSLLVSFKLY
ncbi:MAG: energy transducer TonB [Chlorobi bacterium]|nr:energy transducer TonB [Chlorobiota bacterium]